MKAREVRQEDKATVPPLAAKADARAKVAAVARKVAATSSGPKAESESGIHSLAEILSKATGQPMKEGRMPSNPFAVDGRKKKRAL